MKYVVARTDEIPPGERKIVDVEGRSIGIFNLDGEWFALRDRCPHQGGPLCAGPLWGLVEADEPGRFRYDRDRKVISCPWHGWEFDVRTGRSVCEPVRLRTRRYDVEVRDAGALGDDAGSRPGKVVSVETFFLETDGEYLVLDTGRAGA